MNVIFRNEFGRTKPPLPLKEAGIIIQGNACRLNWEEVCPKNEEDEIYILGNPPYLGFSQQNAEQKIDIKTVFGIKLKVDYIACWFMKASIFIKNSNNSYAFVTTNSICQGEQVPLIWPKIYSLNQEVSFAHQSFYWSNNAKSKAAVICAIIGITSNSKKQKIIYNGGLRTLVDNINPYLTKGKNIIIERRSKSISNLPKMTLGNSPFDGGHLIMSESEKNDFLNKVPDAELYLKKIVGAAEFMRNEFRWCLWISDNQLADAKKYSAIQNRINKTYKMRIESKDAGTRKLAKRSHQFRDRNEAIDHSILIPRVGSSRREYLPCGFFQNDILIGDSAQVIYDSETYLFGLLSSKIHLAWVKSVSGYLKMDVRYSSVISYNTFPFPSISTQRKNEITQAVLRILGEREKHSDKTMAQLYDPDKMPEGLREAHRQNDIIIEKCYRSTPFTSDEERLEYLFKFYEKMIEEEQTKNTLFAKEKKKRSK